MPVVELNEDNSEEYAPYLGKDMAENLSRTFYRGLAVLREGNPEPAAMMIWELHNSEDETKDNENVIEMISAEDEEAGKELFTGYGDFLSREPVRRSHFVIPAKRDMLEKAVLKQAGFSIKLMEGDRIMVKAGDFSKLPLMKAKKDLPSIQPIKETTMRQFRKGIWRCVGTKMKGICEDLSYLPVDWFEPDVSSFSEQDGAISGFILFHKHPSGCLSLQLMVALGKDYQQTLLGMMHHSIQAMEECYDPETLVILNRHNKPSMHLSEKLFPRGFGSPVYIGVREEHL